MLCNKRRHHNEKPGRHDWEVASATTTRESLCVATQVQHSQNKEIVVLKKKKKNTHDDIKKTVTSKMTDHHNKYNKKKVGNTVRIAKTCQRCDVSKHR